MTGDHSGLLRAFNQERPACDECGFADRDMHPHPHRGTYPHATDAMRCATCAEPSGDHSGYTERDVNP